MNPDVAQHDYFGKYPKQHWDEWGHKEGRPSMWAAPVGQQRGFFKPDEVNYTLKPPAPPAGMVYPAVGVWMADGTTTPIPVYSLTPIPARENKVKWGLMDPYPKIIRRHGVNILVKAPVAEDWLPSSTGWVFGHDNHPNGDPRTFVGEPSNAPDGYALRSPKGYPLVYSGPIWDSVLEKWVVPAGTTLSQPMILFGESASYKTDAEIDAYVKDVAARDERIRKWQEEWNKTYYLGPVNVLTLSKNDRGYLFSLIAAYRGIGPSMGLPKVAVHNGDIFRTVLEGYNTDIARAINDGELVEIAAHGQPITPDGPQAALLVSTVQQVFADAAAGRPWVPKSEVRTTAGV
jgi:hypothetical protein